MKKNKIVDLPGLYLKDSDGIIDYKIVKIAEESCTKLFLCAVGSQWNPTIENTVIFKITDTGNGIKIGKKYRELLVNCDDVEGIDYANAEYLRILMNYNDAICHNPSTYKLVIESEVTI